MTPEERRAYQAKYRAANRLTIRENSRRWAARHPDRIKANKQHPEYARAYHLAHRAKKIAAAKLWQMANRDRFNLNVARRRAADPEKFRAYQRKYRATHLDRVRAAARAWAKNHPDHALALVHRRRARRLGNGGSHTGQEWREKLELFAHCCAYCGESPAKLQRDHRVPIARGGTDNISNIVPACRRCNYSKGKRTDVEFLALGGAA